MSVIDNLVAADAPDLPELRQLLLHTPQDALDEADRRVVRILFDSGADYDFVIRGLLSFMSSDEEKRRLAVSVGLTRDTKWAGYMIDPQTNCVVCPQGHPLHGSIKAGVITTSSCSRCHHDRERAYTQVTGRTRNMAPEGFKYVCSHGVECHIDRTGAMSSGYPYHVGGGVCSDPTSVQKVPEHG